jgi:PAS domain S-box-containing protein
MNSNAENDAMVSSKKNIRALLNSNSWSITWKEKLNFFLRAVVAIGLVILMINLLQRRNSIREANDKLVLLTDTKSRYIENYFTQLSQKLVSFSADRQTLEAFNQLNGAFLNIESDNYFTPTVTSLDKFKTLLQGFYTTEISPVIDGEVSNQTSLQAMLPADNKQLIMQYLYLAGNSKPLGAKSSLVKADDESAYSYLHAQYHPEMLKTLRNAGISDILFVDYKSGYVTYSVKKNLDFATSLFEGPYKNSGLGMAFKSAIAKATQGSVTFTDVTHYIPALYQPSFFISVPLFSGTQLIGAVVFELNTTVLDKLLAIEKDRLSHGKSLKTIIIGNDMLYRNNDPEFIESPDQYLRKLKHHANDAEAVTKTSRYGNTSLVQAIDPLPFDGALKGKEGLTRYTTETGNKAICCYAPLKVGSLDWFLVSQLDKSDALAALHRSMLVLIVILLFIALILYFMSGVTSNSINDRLLMLKNNLVALSQGEKLKEKLVESGDEIGQAFKALEKLNNRISMASSFVAEMGKGNIDIDFPVESEEDHYGISMTSLKQSLVLRKEEEEKRKKEDDIRNWTTQGIATFNDVLRMDNNNLEKLSLNIIRTLIEYLNACQGGLFLIEGEETKYLNLIASYAFDRQKFLKKRIEIGEGLAGTCVLEKKTILTNRIPDNYMNVTSGLGGSKPKCLLIVPLKKEEDVLGILELASLADFKPHEVELVEKVAESIASALITVKLHVQTSQYLERFQQQAEEMKSQDEELRQNIEELQATHEQMERLKQEEDERNKMRMKEMEDYRKLLISVLNEVPEKIFLKDDQGRFVIANKLVAENYNRTVDEILGKSVFDFYGKEEATESFQQEQQIIKSGKNQEFEEGDPSKEDGLIVRSIKKPFFIEHLGVTGLFGVQFDISDIKRKEFEALKLAEEIKEKQHEVQLASLEFQKEKALLEALLNTVPEHIFFKDKDSKFIRFSKSMLKLFGLEKNEDLIGKSDFDFFSAEHAKPAFENEQEIIRTGKAVIDLEEKEVLGDGRINWVNTTKMPLISSDGEIIGTFGISKDITHLKKMQQDADEANEELKAQEEELRQNMEEMIATQEDMKRQIDENARMQSALAKEKALMDALMDNIPESIYFKDKQSKFIRFSKSMLKLFGIKKEEELIGKSDFDFFSEEHARPAYVAEQEIIKTGKAIIDLEEKEVLTDGRVNWVTTTKMPLVDANGEIIGTFGISKDISGLKKLQQEAMEKTEELKAQEEELRQNLEEMQSTQEDLMRQIEENNRIQEALGKEKALMDALMDNVNESIYFKDKKSRFIRFSKSMLKLFGLKKEDELIGKSDFDMFAEEHARPAYEGEQQIIKTGIPIIDLEEKEVMEDGRVSWVNTSKMPLRDTKGEIMGTFGISKNITHIKKLELDANEKTNMLEETRKKMALLEKEIHELKTKRK